MLTEHGPLSSLPAVDYQPLVAVKARETGGYTAGAVRGLARLRPACSSGPSHRMIDAASEPGSLFDSFDPGPWGGPWSTEHDTGCRIGF